MRGLGARVVTAVLVLGATEGCKSASPPFEAFEVRREIPVAKGQPDAPPPEGVLRPWRVWINQERPRQKKAPDWRVYAAKDAAMLDIASDGKWRCLLNPIHALGKINEHGKIGSWIASRAIRCSSDGWRTFVEGPVQTSFDPQGNEIETGASAVLYLNEVVGGVPRSTAVVLEGEKQRRPSVD